MKRFVVTPVHMLEVATGLVHITHDYDDEDVKALARDAARGNTVGTGTVCSWAQYHTWMYGMWVTPETPPTCLVCVVEDG